MTLWFNTEPEQSVLTIGPLGDSSVVIRGDWVSHKLVRIGGSDFALNVERVSYNDEELSTGMDVMLMSSVNDLMSVSGQDKDFYDAWAEQMSAIEGFTCQIFNEEPERSGRCDFDEESHDCDHLWSSMRHMDIEIDGKSYVVPPDSQTVQFDDKLCQPGLYFKESQSITTFG